jgi:hypothetical protein
MGVTWLVLYPQPGHTHDWLPAGLIGQQDVARGELPDS